jgi:hypothetical protein
MPERLSSNVPGGVPLTLRAFKNPHFLAITRLVGLVESAGADVTGWRSPEI